MTDAIDQSLDPENFLQRLETRWVGRPYYYRAAVASTNSELEQLARQGAPHGTMMVADQQHAGRGRLGRSWISPPGVNLYFSLLLRPSWNCASLPPVSLATAVGLVEALSPLVPDPLQVKWPNDIMIMGRKCSGILVEVSTAKQQLEHVIIGIGINVNQRDFTSDLVDSATSLSLLADRTWERGLVLNRVLVCLEDWIHRLDHGPSGDVISEWLEYAVGIGEQVCVDTGFETIEGVAVGVDDDGALLLNNAGHVRRVLTGTLRRR